MKERVCHAHMTPSGRSRLNWKLAFHPLTLKEDGGRLRHETRRNQARKRKIGWIRDWSPRHLNLWYRSHSKRKWFRNCNCNVGGGKCARKWFRKRRSMVYGGASISPLLNLVTNQKEATQGQGFLLPNRGYFGHFNVTVRRLYLHHLIVEPIFNHTAKPYLLVCPCYPMYCTYCNIISPDIPTTPESSHHQASPFITYTFLFLLND